MITKGSDVNVITAFKFINIHCTVNNTQEPKQYFWGELKQNDENKKDSTKDDVHHIKEQK